MPRMDADGETHTEGDETSPFGSDHTFGTGQSYLENPLQGIDDLADVNDGDGNDGGFADPGEFFLGTSDPDGDGNLEESAGGHEADLPDASPDPDNSDTVTLDGDDLPSMPEMPQMPEYVPVPSSGGQSSMMTVVAVVVAAVAAVVALAGGASADG